MKAIQIKQTGGPDVMELVDLPVPEPKPNEAGRTTPEFLSQLNADSEEGWLGSHKYLMGIVVMVVIVVVALLYFR